MANRQLIIGNKNYSSWSLRAWLLLKHLQIPFEEIRIPLFQPGYHQKILQHSSAGRVPILKEDGHTIWDSLAIAEYLAEQHPTLWPADASLRAYARAAVAEMHAGFMALRQELPMNCRAIQRQLEYSEQAARDIERIEAIWLQCQQLEQQHQIQGPWLLGDFGIIDAFYAPVALRLQGYQIPLQAHSRSYLQCQLDNPLLKQWIEEGQNESEIIEEEEVGTTSC
ncbi:MAG: glutathione S-transferase family protein [Motiliproteus sp.]|nr:glutathione S-transferase family protein [Motiliproteus sp.]MCW9051289.1 glutathione S-transferase family protein [Motiliproteus sp.]